MVTTLPLYFPANASVNSFPALVDCGKLGSETVVSAGAAAGAQADNAIAAIARIAKRRQIDFIISS